MHRGKQVIMMWVTAYRKLNAIWLTLKFMKHVVALTYPQQNESIPKLF